MRPTSTKGPSVKKLLDSTACTITLHRMRIPSFAISYRTRTFSKPNATRAFESNSLSLPAGMARTSTRPTTNHMLHTQILYNQEAVLRSSPSDYQPCSTRLSSTLRSIKASLEHTSSPMATRPDLATMVTSSVDGILPFCNKQSINAPTPLPTSRSALCSNCSRMTISTLAHSSSCRHHLWQKRTVLLKNRLSAVTM